MVRSTPGELGFSLHDAVTAARIFNSKQFHHKKPPRVSINGFGYFTTVIRLEIIPIQQV